MFYKPKIVPLYFDNMSSYVNTVLRSPPKTCGKRPSWFPLENRLMYGECSEAVYSLGCVIINSYVYKTLCYLLTWWTHMIMNNGIFHLQNICALFCPTPKHISAGISFAQKMVY